MSGLVASVQALIREELAARGMTQRELAQGLGISEPRVSQMLSRPDNLSLRTIEKIAAVLQRGPE